jgi:hypothetical protein
MNKSRARWLVFLPAALIAFFASTANADTVEGLTVTGFEWSGDEPLRDAGLYSQCGYSTYPNIDQSWDGVPFEQCGGDYFMLRYEGWITIPAGVSSVRFAIASDDGSAVSIGGVEFGAWVDQGCSYWYSDTLGLASGVPLPIEAWFYERGGATCFSLWWQLGGLDQDWTVVPASAFTQSVSVATSTIAPLPPETLPAATSTTVAVSVPSEMTTTTQALPASTTTEVLEWPTTTFPDRPTATDVGLVPPADTNVPTSTTEPTTTTLEQPPVETLPPPAQVDLFDGSHEDVIPAGSTISIAQRRTVVAVSAVFFIAMPPVTSSSRSRSEKLHRR